MWYELYIILLYNLDQVVSGEVDQWPQPSIYI